MEPPREGLDSSWMLTFRAHKESWRRKLLWLKMCSIASERREDHGTREMESGHSSMSAWLDIYRRPTHSDSTASWLCHLGNVMEAWPVGVSENVESPASAPWKQQDKGILTVGRAKCWVCAAGGCQFSSTMAQGSCLHPAVPSRLRTTKVALKSLHHSSWCKPHLAVLLWEILIPSCPSNLPMSITYPSPLHCP